MRGVATGTRLAADYFLSWYGKQNAGVGRRWVRPVVISTLLVFAAFLLYWATSSTAEQEPEVKRTGVSGVFPEPSAVAVRQDAIGADLDFGWTGRLRIDNRDIPDDQIDRIAGINRLSFTPGAGKEIETLDEGRHCASLIYWKASETEDAALRPYVWCFTAA
jgi:hypothetical protein